MCVKQDDSLLAQFRNLESRSEEAVNNYWMANTSETK